MLGIDNLLLEQFESMVQGGNRDSLLRKARSLTPPHVLTLSLCCNTLVTDGISLIALYLGRCQCDGNFGREERHS